MNGRVCSVCSGRLTERYARVVDPDSGARFAILACTECGLGHTDPVPADLGRFYGEAYHGQRHGLTAELCARRRLRWLRRHHPAAGRVLDVGCGDGTFLDAARQHGWVVCGTERDEATSRARAMGIEVHEDLAMLPTGRFQAITVWHSLEHVVAPLALLRELRSLLADDGVLLVAVPDAGGLQARIFGDRWFHLDVPRHLYHFDNKSLAFLLKRAGFDVVERWSTELEYDLFGWVQSALDRVLLHPRVLFHRLTGKPARGGRVAFASSLVLGAMAATAALALTLHGSVTHDGGTLVMVARRARPETE